MRPLRILIWHVHGSYLYYLAHANCEFYLPTRPDRTDGYGGRTPGGYPLPDNVIEVPAEVVRYLKLDCIVFQTPKNYRQDQYEILSEQQQKLPRIYLEHNPPREHPTNTKHWVDDPNMLLVHVTHFNDLMWDSNRTPTRVIEHGVVEPKDVQYSGELERGIVVVNDLPKRGRLAGYDIFEVARKEVPLDLAGINADTIGGIGVFFNRELPAIEARYRFFFNPIRYTSLGLSVLEAMMVGLPVIGLATTEMVTTIENGVSGYLHTDPKRVIEYMRELIADPAEARRLGEGAKRTAQERFNIQRFARDWEDTFRDVVGKQHQAVPEMQPAPVAQMG